MRYGRFARGHLIPLLGLAVAGVSIVAATAAAGSRSETASIPARTFIDVRQAVPTNLDPNSASNDNAVYELVPTYSSPLVRLKGGPIDAKTVPGSAAVTPYMATSWTRESNGSYLFQLRRGVKSAAGNTMTATDVKYSFDRAAATDGSADTILGTANIELKKSPVTIVNDHAVRIAVSAPTSLALNALTYHPVAVLDSTEVKKHATPTDPWAKEWLASHSATFGPYTIESFLPGQALTLKVNPNFFGPRPYFTRIVLRAIPDAAVRLQLMLSGNASHTTGLDWSQFKAAGSAKSGNVRAETITSLGLEIMNLNQSFAPFKDANVRKAISLAIDRDAINRSIYSGYATPARYIISSKIPLPFKPTPVSPNPTRARQLLTQAGYPNGFTFSVYATPSFTGNYISDELSLIKSQLAQVGVTMNVNVVATPGEYFAVSKPVGVSIVSLGPDPVYVFRNQFSNANPFGAGTTYGWAGTPGAAKFNSVVGSALKTSAGPRQNRFIKSLYTMLESEQPNVSTMEVPVQNVTSASITGYASYAYPGIYYEHLTRRSP